MLICIYRISNLIHKKSFPITNSQLALQLIRIIIFLQIPNCKKYHQLKPIERYNKKLTNISRQKTCSQSRIYQFKYYVHIKVSPFTAVSCGAVQISVWRASSSPIKHLSQCMSKCLSCGRTQLPWPSQLPTNSREKNALFFNSVKKVSGFTKHKELIPDLKQLTKIDLQKRNVQSLWSINTLQ